MISKSLKWLAGVCLATVASFAAALPITGQLSILSTVAVTKSGGSVTQINFQESTVNGNASSGTFAGLMHGEDVSIPNNPWVLASTTFPFVVWEVDGFTFTLDSWEYGQLNGTTAFQGKGWITSTDPTYDTTAAAWYLSFTSATQAVISFSSETVAADVPEPATLALLGAGLIGLGVARRKTA